MQKDSSPLESVFLGNILTALVCLPFMFNTLPNQNDFLCLLVLGVLQLGLPYIFYSKAIKNVSAMDAVLIPVIEPLLNPIWVLILLDEVPGRWAISGGVIVITAITLRYFVRFITSGGKK